MGQEQVDMMHLSPQDDIFLPGRAIWWKTVLVETGHGEIRRVVSVLALHIRQGSKQEFGLTFDLIGKFEDSDMVAVCQLQETRWSAARCRD
jgi:hypothetical protein